MSSSTSQPPHGFTKLPNELMSMIFRYLATPYEIQPGDLACDKWRSSASLEVKDTHLEELGGLRRGRALGFVCKTWYILQAPFAYEWITICRQKHLTSLLNILCHPPKWANGTKLNTVGLYTKRLDINFKDYQMRPSRVLKVLVAIVKQLPNLEVLTVKTILNFAEHKMDPRILDAISPKLKVTTWLNASGYLPQEDDFYSFLKSHPNLVAMNLPPQYNRLTVPKDYPVLVPSLEHNCIHCPPHCNPNFLGPLPSLKRLTITPRSEWPYLLPDITDLITRSKATLTSIQLNLDHLAWIRDDVLRWLLRNSPQLRRVDIVVASPLHNMCPLTWRLPPFVAEVGLRVVSLDFPSSDVETLALFTQLTHVSRWKGEEPATVQFLEDSITEYVVDHPSIFLDNRQNIMTSWMMPSGEMFDLLSLMAPKSHGKKQKRKQKR